MEDPVDDSEAEDLEEDDENMGAGKGEDDDGKEGGDAGIDDGGAKVDEGGLGSLGPGA